MHLEALDDSGKDIFSRLAPFGERFYLAGGTALALEIGHRVSADFDLFAPRAVPDTLLQEVERLFSGYAIRPSVNNSDELTVFVAERKITFLHYPFPPLLPLVGSASLPLLSVKELAATKAYTIGRRGSHKDYVDIFFILSEKHSSLPEIMELAEKKYSDAFNARLFLEQLVYLDDVEDIDIVFLKKAVTREGLRAFFENEVRAMPL